LSIQLSPSFSAKRSTATPYIKRQHNDVITRRGETYSEASKEFLGSAVGDGLALSALVVLKSMHGLNRRVSRCHF
jgi:hypothetical protein